MTQRYTKVEILNMVKEQKISMVEGLNLIEKLNEKAASFFAGSWKKKEAGNIKDLEGKDILIFTDFDHDYFSKLERKNKLVYVDDSKSYDEYGRFMAKLDMIPDIIVFAWDSMTQGSERIDLSVFSMLNMYKELISLHVRKGIDIVYIFTNEDTMMVDKAMIAFMRSLKMEKDFGFYSIRIEDKSDLAVALESELHYKDSDESKYDLEQNRYIRTVVPAEPAQYEVPFKDGGIYLISGGAGKIGKILINALVRKYKAVYIMMGRSDRAGELDEIIQIARNNGSKLIYYRCDGTDESEIQKLSGKIGRVYGEINGVIHLAGVLRDGIAYRKEHKDFWDVVNSKVTIAENLYKVLKPEFISFASSICAFTGNIGQCDYSYANAYLGALAKKINIEKGKRTAYSIGFPLWENGGMHPTNQDIAAISDSEGVRIFMDAHTYKEEDIYYLDNNILSRLKQKEPDKKIKNNHMKYDERKLREMTENYLIKVIAQEMKIPEGNLSVNTSLHEIGMDSIMIMEVTRAMEKELGSISKTLFFEYSIVSQIAEELMNVKYEEITDMFKERLKYTPIKPEPVYEAENSEAKEIQTIERNMESTCQDIAIIGISGKYAMSDNMDELWSNLKEGKDCITEIPADRWDFNQYFENDKSVRGKSYSKWGGFIDSYNEFDPLFFKISPREADYLDPQERVFLETAWETIEDSGYTLKKLREYNVGVYVGVMYGHYQLFNVEEQLRGEMAVQSSSYASIANRVSYALDLNGASVAVDTMCSSSLTAIHIACQSIRENESDMAIAGGINITSHPLKYIMLSQQKFLSTDGRCRSFGEGGDGYVPGEGSGAVMLKRLDRAQHDGDRIYAVIKGSTINHGGKTKAFTVPSPVAQAALIRNSFKKFGVEPESLNYIEAHGPGTSLGDPIEINSLTKAYATPDTELRSCAIGSIKSNIGHTESAAGIASISKVILQMLHKQLVPSIHSDILNKNIDFESSVFYVQRELSDWNRVSYVKENETKFYPRRAGVSSFGAGGANAFIIMEEYEDHGVYDSLEGDVLFVLSARNKDRLKSYVDRFRRFIKRGLGNTTKDRENMSIESGGAEGLPALYDMAYMLKTCREQYETRFAAIVSDYDELYDKLSAFRDDEAISGIYVSDDNVYNQTISSVLQGSAMDEFINKLFEAREYGKLAVLWCGGVHINWEKCYERYKLKKCLIPTYPFNNEKYWVPRAVESNSRIRTFPLIDDYVYNGHGGNGITLKKRIEQGDPIIAGHIVNGQKVLPGVAYIEMTLEALEKIEKAHKYNIESVYWLKPLYLHQENYVDLFLEIGEKDSKMYFEFYTVSHNGKIIHSNGKLNAADSDEPYMDMINDLSEYKNIKGNELYEVFEKAGVEYKNIYRGVQDVYIGKDTVLGNLKTGSGGKRYFLFPGMADSALQTMAVLNNDGGKTTVPYYIGRVLYRRPLPDTGKVYVKKNNKGNVNVMITDTQQAVCVMFENVVLRGLANDKIKFLYYSKWKAIPAGQEKIMDSKKSLILHPKDFSLFADKMVKKIKRKSLSYEIENVLQDVEGFATMLREHDDIHEIFFLGLNNEIIDPYDRKEFEQSQDLSINALFIVVQALMDLGFNERETIFNVITNNTISINEYNRINPYAAVLHGFTLSMGKEVPKWTVKCLDIDLFYDTENHSISQIMAKSKAPAPDVVVYRENQRYIRGVHPINIDTKQDTVFTKHGVYMIFGGAGGIGAVLAAYLSRKVKANIVLVGRSELNETIGKKLENIDSYGGKAVYIKADLADLDSIENAIKETKAKFGMISGVIHSALVLNDKTIRFMTKDVLESSLEPKVRGSVNLNKAFRNEKIDFLLYFSSANALMAPSGQGNYSAACTFEDAYAEYQNLNNAYPVKYVNWGYWGSIGVVSSEKYNKNMSKTGVKSIEPDEGMKILEILLQNNINSLIPYKAEERVIERLGIRTDETIKISEDSRVPELNISVDNDTGADEMADIRQSTDTFSGSGNIGALLLLSKFQEMGYFKKSGERKSIISLKQELRIIEKYNRMFMALLDILKRYKYIKVEKQNIMALPLIDNEKTQGSISNISGNIDDLMQKYAGIRSYMKLVRLCIDAYPQVLSGEESYMGIMFPGGSKELVEDIYSGNIMADFFNKKMAAIVKQSVKDAGLDGKTTVSILEVGAGTGGTSAFVLQELKEYANNIKYYYTDISKSFVEHGRRKFKNDYSYTEFNVLNIEEDILSQGFEYGRFDIVLATNVLHATRSLDLSLSRIKQLMKRNAVLIINEVTALQDFATLTFGLTDGWWIYEDEYNRIPLSPLLDTPKWKKVLGNNGFKNFKVFGIRGSDDYNSEQSLLMARSDGISVAAEKDREDDTNSIESLIADNDIAVMDTLIHTGDDDSEYSYDSIKTNVKSILSRILNLSERDIDERASLESYGIDSLVAIEIMDELTKEYKDISASILLDNASVNSIGKEIMESRVRSVTTGKTQEKTGKAGEQIDIKTIGLYDDIDAGRFREIWTNDNMQEYIGTLNNIEDIGLDNDKIKHLVVSNGDKYGIEVVMAGKGEPLVLIAGYGSTAVLYREQINYFKKKYQVVVLNIPAFGLSYVGNEVTVSLEGISDIFMETLEILGIKKPFNLIGNSFGTLIELQIATKYADCVKSLVSLSGFAKIDDKFKDVSLNMAIKKDLIDISPELKETINKGGYTNSNIIKYNEYLKSGNKFSAEDLLKDIKAPSLIIHGDKDTVIELSLFYQIVSGIENVESMIVNEGGHFLPVTHHEEINKAIEEFLGKNE